MQEAIKRLVRQGLVNATVSEGFVFGISNTGQEYIKKLKSEYAKQYKKIATDAVKQFRDYSELELDRMINESAIKVGGGIR